MLSDMQPGWIVGPSETHQLTHHDGTVRTVYTTDREVPVDDGILIVSRTDTTGIITDVNDSFVLMSGYSTEELIGAPHHILRHPAMPKAAFQGLWDTVAQGTRWHGYVKNLRKDGAFYWVYATIIPNIRQGQIVGYTSVRRKPSRTQVAAAEQLYRTLA